MGSGMRERRRAARARANLKASWRQGSAEGEGVIKNISAAGCFIEARPIPAVGAALRLRMEVMPLLSMMVQGVVIRAVGGNGFALQFKGMGVTERTTLRRLIRHVRLQTA